MIEEKKKNWIENIVNVNENVVVSKKNAREVVDMVRVFNKKKAERIDNCASTLIFQFDMETGNRKLVNANFCHDRFCPECSRRKSRLMYHNLKKVLTVAGENHNQEFVHFTLSLKNCKKEDLKKSLDELFHGFITMMKRGQFRKSINGWYRNLEITYNQEKDTLHPHLHVILSVDKDYFRKYSGKYLTQEFVIKEFRSACQIDYDPTVDLRKAYSKKKTDDKQEQLHSIVAECSKYVTKMSDILNVENKDLKIALLESLVVGLKGRRMCAYGGLLRMIFKDLQLENEENADLLNVEEQEVVLGENCVFGVFSYDKKEEKYKLVKVLDNYLDTFDYWKKYWKKKRDLKKERLEE